LRSSVLVTPPAHTGHPTPPLHDALPIYGGELQRGDDSELSAARTTERPEQLRLVRIVAVHHAAVGQYDLCSDQAIAGQSVLSSEQADAAGVRPVMPTVGPHPAGNVRPCACRAG